LRDLAQRPLLLEMIVESFSLPDPHGCRKGAWGELNCVGVIESDRISARNENE